MQRSTLMTTGLIILFGAAAIGSLPAITSYTGLASSWSDATWTLGSHILLEVARIPGGHVLVSVTPFIWVIAALGQAMFLAGWLANTRRKTGFRYRF